MVDRSGISYSRLGIGTAQFGMDYGVTNSSGKVSQDQIQRILDLSRQNCISTIDTAWSYGDAEVQLGMSGLESFKVVSKVSKYHATDLDAYSWLMKNFQISLTNLGVDSIYALLFHSPEDLLGAHGKDLVRAVDELKRAGLVNKIGYSVYSPNILESLSGVLQPDIVQAPLNVFDTRLVETGWLERLKANMVEVHTRSAFLQGTLLQDDLADLPYVLRPWGELFEKFGHWARSEGHSKLEAALGFCLSFKDVDAVIVGVNSVSELAGIIRASGKLLGSLPEFNCKDDMLINPARWGE